MTEDRKNAQIISCFMISICLCFRSQKGLNFANEDAFLFMNVLFSFINSFLRSISDYFNYHIYYCIAGEFGAGIAKKMFKKCSYHEADIQRDGPKLSGEKNTSWNILLIDSCFFTSF